MSARGAVTGGWVGSVGSPTAPACFMGRSVGCGRDPAVRASCVCPCARVTGVIPVVSALACASWNGTACCPGAVTTLWMNATTSGAVRSSQDSVCVGQKRGNTGARTAMAVNECHRGTPRERPWAGSRAVSCSCELNNCLTSSSEITWVTPFERPGRVFHICVGTKRLVELRNASLSTSRESTLLVTFSRFRMSIPNISWEEIGRGRTSRLVLTAASYSNACRLKRSKGLVNMALLTRSKSSSSWS